MCEGSSWCFPAPDQLLEGVAVIIGQSDVVALTHGSLRVARDTSTVACSPNSVKPCVADH